MRKRYWIPVGIAVLLTATYFIGPKRPVPQYAERLPKLPDDLNLLEDYIQSREEKLPVRKDNQARIVWNDEPFQPTEYSIVYLHGFGGSYRDGYPVNVKLAEKLGANLYLSRWAGHGLQAEAALQNFSPDNAWESAKEALVIGNKIGKKVIILSTSTGGTLALRLAATYPEKIFALVNLSPNIEDDFDGAWVLNSPWGYQLAQLVSFGEEMEIEHEEKRADQYWDTVYPSKALVDLQVLLGTSMKASLFRKIRTPVLTLYYRKNFMEEDDHVEVEVYPAVHELFSTPEKAKKLVRLTTPGTHFIGSGIKSEDTEVVLEEIIEYLREQLGVSFQE